MNKQNTIQLSKNGRISTIWLNRPDIHNAINIEMIREITEAMRALESDSETALIIFRSNGDHFCSGADLGWMKDGLQQSAEELTSESLELAQLFEMIYMSRKVTISAVHGKAIGGAIGLVAASDIAIADDTAIFSFSEVKLGLIPATISPYVFRKMGSSRTREMMLTGRAFDAIEAYESGLVHRLCKPGGLEQSLSSLSKILLSNGPSAMTGIKELMRHLEGNPDGKNLPEDTARLIAKFRLSDEGQEGMNAFLEKRKPDWLA